jgi:hypothetical protein
LRLAGVNGARRGMLIVAVVATGATAWLAFLRVPLLGLLMVARAAEEEEASTGA